MLKKKFIKVRQNKFEMYLVSMTSEELIDFTEVRYFKSETKEGYQRSLIPSHYLKITNFLKSKDVILPPQILIAINHENLNVKEDVITIKNKMRLVDGQHRVEGIKALKEKFPEKYDLIEKMEFPVTIMVVEELDDIKECETFIRINSLGKKVKTDLAIELRDDINTRSSKEITTPENKAKRVVDIFDKNDKYLWNLKIKRGNDNTREKPISLLAFTKSLKGIVNNYKKPEEEIAEIIDEAWNIVKEKWSECFEEWKRYNILKGIGVFPIHIILEECIISGGDTLENFRSIIDTSELKSNDWVLGGKLSPYNSMKGFKEIVKLIKNEKDL